MVGASSAWKPRIANALRWRMRAVETIATLAAARVLIRFAPFSWWRGTLGAMGSGGGSTTPAALGDADRQVIGLVARDIRKWSQRLPFAVVCLPRAMAARWMLSWRGIDGRIVIGARTGQALKSFDLHAWLMVGDICVTGDAERQSFEAFAYRSQAKP